MNKWESNPGNMKRRNEMLLECKGTLWKGFAMRYGTSREHVDKQIIRVKTGPKPKTPIKLWTVVHWRGICDTQWVARSPGTLVQSCLCGSLHVLPMWVSSRVSRFLAGSPLGGNMSLLNISMLDISFYATLFITNKKSILSLNLIILIV